MNPSRSAPHLHAFDSTRSLMLDVCLALLPALIWGVYVFGFRALVLTLVSVFTAVLSEALFQFAFRRKKTFLDLSAVVTGLLLALSLPVSAPLWVPALGAAFAVIVLKGAFGGIGKNFLNPALGARLFLDLVFRSTLSRATAPFAALPLFGSTAGAAEAETVQSVLKSGAFPENVSLFDLLSGSVPGRIGEVSVLLLLAGGLYLLVKRVVSWQIPLAFTASFFAFSVLFPAFGNRWEFALWQLLSGGVIFVIFYQATDVVTTPVTGTGRLLFGIGCGALTFLFGRTGLYAEKAVLAVLLMNLLAPLLDYLRMLPRLIRARYR